MSFSIFASAGAFLMSVALLSAQTVSINTFAGHDVIGIADGVSSSARFSHPNSIAADSTGNIYVADTENSTIRKITPNGIVTTFAGSPGITGSTNGMGTSARFFAPQGIAVDSAGSIYVADTGNAMIRKITSEGLVSTLAGSAGYANSFDGQGTNAQFFQPQALTVDRAGNVFVADTWNHTIRKISMGGAVTTRAGLAGNPGSLDGSVTKARFNSPTGIAVDSATNLYVADFSNHTIRRITASGSVSTIAGSPGLWGNVDGTNKESRFFQPQGIVADNAGNIFVSDSGNQTIRKISAIGTNWVVTTVAGLPGTAGNADGNGSSARFSFPGGLAKDGAGYLYIADLGNNTVRTERIVPPTLRFSVSGNQLMFSWPVSASAFVFESTTALFPGEVWIAQTNGVIASGDEFVTIKNRQNGSEFYRLRRP